MKKKLLFVVAFFMYLTIFTQNMSRKFTIKTIAFYNVENLFDTINNPTKDDELSPIMGIKGNKSGIYFNKINQIAKVISQIGFEKTKKSPTIIGLAEVENDTVLKDLLKSNYLKDKGYEIIHYDSPDKRGIDVALLYQKDEFKPIHHQVFNPNIYKDNQKIHTRDQLLVSGYLDNELIHIIVNHWPSRRGGEEKSRPFREKAAYKNVQILEKIKETEKNPKVFLLGDFNDDPTSSSLKKVLKTKKNKNTLKENELYNPYENMFKRGLNTLGYRDNINLFDQIIISSSLISTSKDDFSSYKFFKAMIFNKRFLTNKKGKFKGYPFRSFSYQTYLGGYSDHYPVYIYVIKEQG